MVTIVLPISRTDYLRPVFQCLNNLEKPKETELIIVTDGDEELEAAIDKRLDSLNYSVTQVVSFGDGPADAIKDRRRRIAEIHNYVKEYINPDSKYIFCIEDDTVYPPDALMKMLTTIKQRYVGYVEGLELGRWNTPYVGAWDIDDLDRPLVIKSVLKTRKLQLIDAGGLYCCLVNAELYLNHKFEPYDNVVRVGLGCDVNFGMYIRKKGYICYLDWSIECDHIGSRGSVNIGNTTPRQVMFEKMRGKWNCRTVV